MPHPPAPSTLVIDGHPNADSLTAALARRYAEANGDARVLAVRELEFDPIMHLGYTRRQPLEPDLDEAWEAILAAKHVVIATPVWWGSVPALLQGFFDRLLLPGRAFDAKASLPLGLLKGRTARILLTTDSPLIYLKLTGDTTVRQLRRHVLGYVGISPAAVTRFGPVKTSTPEQRGAWLARAQEAGAKDARRLQRAHPPVGAHLPEESPARIS